MSLDPTESNPNHYKVVFENDRVRVLEYTDAPGDKTTPHKHPDSVMYTLSAFRRRLYSDDSHRDVDMPAGLTGWLPAQLAIPAMGLKPGLNKIVIGLSEASGPFAIRNVELQLKQNWKHFDYILTPANR